MGTLNGFLNKLDIDVKRVEVKAFIGDVLDMDIHLYSILGVSLLKTRGVGDTIDIVGISVYLSEDEGITIKIK